MRNSEWTGCAASHMMIRILLDVGTVRRNPAKQSQGKMPYALASSGPLIRRLRESSWPVSRSATQGMTWRARVRAPEHHQPCRAVNLVLPRQWVQVFHARNVGASIVSSRVPGSCESLRPIVDCLELEARDKLDEGDRGVRLPTFQSFMRLRHLPAATVQNVAAILRCFAQL